jgi:arsenite/tail-anchored protein-transporting ATPase
VGKTTASLAFCASLAKNGESVLLVEIGETSRSGLSYDFKKLGSHFWGIRITGFESLREYLLRQIKIERLFKLLFDHPPIRYFFEVAPALRDLMILGKIVHESESGSVGKNLAHVVVDAPATGHAMFLLNTPQVVQNLTRFGPIFDRAKHISEALSDSKRTSIHLVTLARAVVTGETLELIANIRKAGFAVERILVNRLLLAPTGDSAKDLKTSNDPLAKRAYSEWREVQRLRKLSKLPIEVVLETDSLGDLEELAKWFERRVKYG